MSDLMANSSEQRRPNTTRKRSERLQTQEANDTSSTKDKVGRKAFANEMSTADVTEISATPNPPQEIKEKRKPRKLAVRNVQPSAAVRTPLDNKQTSGAPKEPSLNTRVSALEESFQRINKRIDSNSIEIGKLQAYNKPSKSNAAKKDTSITRFTMPPGEQEYNTTTLPTPPDHEPRDQLHTKPSQIEELSDEEIEAIPRFEEPSAETRVDQQRSVALKGNYTIPLPSTLSTDDVRAVQSGLVAAGSVAREIAAAMRGNGKETPVASSEQRRGKRSTTQSPTTMNTFDELASPRSWSSLLSSCTQLVTSAANAIEMEAAIESTTAGYLSSEQRQRQKADRRNGQRTTMNHSSQRGTTWQRPAATAPTKSSSSRSVTKAEGPRLNMPSRNRDPPERAATMESKGPKTATSKKVQSSVPASLIKKDTVSRPRAGSRVHSSPIQAAQSEKEALSRPKAGSRVHSSSGV